MMPPGVRQEAFDLPTQAPPALPAERLNLIFTDNAGCRERLVRLDDDDDAELQRHLPGVPRGVDARDEHDLCLRRRGLRERRGARGQLGRLRRMSPARRGVRRRRHTVAGCHGTDGAAQPRPPSIPDRRGRHDTHIAAIVANNPGTSANDESTCNWCHPGGAHSGGDVTPAEVMDGTTTHFKDIKGVNDSGDGASQAGGNISCSGLECHYRTTMTAADWYGSLTMSCAYCHQSDVAYSQAVNPLLGIPNVAATGAAPIPGMRTPVRPPPEPWLTYPRGSDIAGMWCWRRAGGDLLAETVSGATD
jgi:predicted CxxxxCH...CXXCH cytochrome family protein